MLVLSAPHKTFRFKQPNYEIDLAKYYEKANIIVGTVDDAMVSDRLILVEWKVNGICITNREYDIIPIEIRLDLIVYVDLELQKEAEKINLEIDSLKVILDKEQKKQKDDVEEINTFQREVELKTVDLMMELIDLKQQLVPENEETEKIKQHFEDVKNPPPAEPTKFDRAGEDKVLKKLYMKLARIYHPDKAPINKKEEYAEIFKTLGSLRQAGNLEAMKKFSKTLKKAVMSGGIDIDKLKSMKKTITDQIVQIKRNRDNFLQSEIYSEMMQYREHGEDYIEIHRDRIRDAINSLKQQIIEKETKSNFWDSFN